MLFVKFEGLIGKQMAFVRVVTIFFFFCVEGGVGGGLEGNILVCEPV